MPNFFSNAEVKSIFRAAADQSKSKFSLFNKKQVDYGDLFNAWSQEGSPTGEAEIRDFLKKFGFNDKSVNKVFTAVLGDEGADGSRSAQVEELANYIIKNGYKDEIIQFIETNYKEQLFQQKGMFGRKKDKVVYEDIRRIFEMMAKEDRPELESLLKLQEQNSLGRSRK